MLDWNGLEWPPLPGRRLMVEWAGNKIQGEVIAIRNGFLIVEFQPVGYSHIDYQPFSRFQCFPIEPSQDEVFAW